MDQSFRWLALVFIGVLAVLVRLPYLSGMGFYGDLGIFQGWIGAIQTNGLFHFYRSVSERPYPPISIFLLATSTMDIPSIKLPSLIAEVLIVSVAYSWLRPRTILRWLIAIVLALHPGLIITTAWWGQNDALFTLAVLLLLIALNRDFPLIAWVCFGIALATKQQSIVIAPLIFILSFRRYGWRKTVIGALLAAGIVIGLFLPFILATDFQTALNPYLVISGAVSALTNNAFNLWYAVAKLSGIATSTADRNLLLGPLTYSQSGLLLLAIYTLVVSVVMWKQYNQRREFAWAAALYLGSFTLQTQIHERYLYPASIFALLALQQDPKIILAAFGIMFTFTYNLISLAVPLDWLGLPLVASSPATLPIALLNVMLLFEMQRVVIGPLGLAWGKRLRASGQVFFKTLRLAAAGLILIIFLATSGTALGTYAIAQWLALHAADHSHIIMDQSARYTSVMSKSTQASTADWRDTKDVTEKDSLAWLGDGFHYLLVDLTDDKSNLRQQTLSTEPATLLYEYQSPLRFGPHLALFWTFRPDHPLNITFDDSLELIGYNESKNGDQNSLLFHWYTQHTTSATYTTFIHLIDPQTGNLIAQADTPVGGGNHPTNTWRLNELVFETVTLPAVSSPYQIRIGLYQQDQRAAIKDAQGNPLGDHIDLKP